MYNVWRHDIVDTLTLHTCNVKSQTLNEYHIFKPVFLKLEIPGVYSNSDDRELLSFTLTAANILNKLTAVS